MNITFDNAVKMILFTRAGTLQLARCGDGKRRCYNVVIIIMVVVVVSAELTALL